MKKRLLLATIWLVGMVPIWHFMPYGPRDGWQPPADEAVFGFVDDHTVVTVRQVPGLAVATFTGPIHLWNVHSGELVASRLDERARFRNVQVAQEVGCFVLVHAGD